MEKLQVHNAEPTHKGSATYSEKGRIILLPHPVKCLGKNP